MDVVTMSESDSLESDSSSVLFRLCVSLGAGVLVALLSAGSKSKPSASSKGEVRGWVGVMVDVGACVEVSL